MGNRAYQYETSPRKLESEYQPVRKKKQSKRGWGGNVSGKTEALVAVTVFLALQKNKTWIQLLVHVLL